MYAQTANTRKNIEDILKRREITVSSLINSYDAYEDLLAKSSKGLEFYRKLEINVSKLLQRVKSTCKVQEEEREQILAQDSKNIYDKTDVSLPSAYDQGRPRSGPKLKDYLNSKATEKNATGYQNPYYNFYKERTNAMLGTMQADSIQKPLTTDMGDKNLIQSPSSLSASEISSSSVKSAQPYHNAAYNDYRTSSPYSYGAQTYYENQIASGAINQNYLPITSASTTNAYQQPAMSVPVASNSNVQYPASSYLPNEQTLSMSTTGQDKYRGISHSTYNVSNTALQYDSYQSPTNYGGYNVATPYVLNQDKASMAVKSAEVPAQIQPVPQTPNSMIGSVGVSNTASVDGQTSYGIVHQVQQYDNQKTTLSQEMPQSDQNVVRSQLPVKDNTQNYSLPQTGHSEMTYPQNYSNTAYYNPVQYTHATYDSGVAPPAQYMQSQQPSMSNQPVHSVASTNETPTSYSPNLHSDNSVQYSQQTSTEQNKQSYTDKTYAAYGAQMQVNAATPNYSSTYQNYQHDTSGVPYQQTNMLPGDTSNVYAYLNSSSSSEMIQSHVKSTTIQSYPQSYQYPQSQQVSYPGYVQYPNYSQDQNYAYMQNAQGTGTVAYAYNPAGQAQGYAYTSDSQNIQTSQTFEATVNPSSVTTSSNYQQQEINSTYTNAGNNAVVSQTPSSQYSQVYQSQSENDTYYTTPYGLQMQVQGTSHLANVVM